MVEKLINLLIEKNYHISCAESCTGGLIANKIVEIPNASKVLDMSFVTYSNESKEELLGVSRDTIMKYGVVSEEVTYEMAKGTMEKARAEVSVVTSGIAGPTGDTPNKPIGMVCFGFGIKNKIYTETKFFGNIGRNKVREEACNYAIEYLYNLVKEE